MSFRQDWLDRVKERKSVLCAGLDPAEFEMGRGIKGLPVGIDKKQWSIDYIKSVLPYCSAVKPNIQYWVNYDLSVTNSNDMESLFELGDIVIGGGAVYILDAKLADIVSTNDAGLYHHAKKGFDAVTFSPFAGNMKEAAEQAKKRKIGLISMCLMSNPEFEKQKNILVPVMEDEAYYDYDKEDITYVNSIPHIKQYIQLAHDAQKYGVDAILIGAPSPKNHIKEEEIERVRHYAGGDMIVLMPGVGAQKGEPETAWKYFDKDKIIVNVGRDLMLPEGSASTKEDHIKAAENYSNRFNELRETA